MTIGAIAYEPTLGDSVADAFYDPLFGVNPLVGVGLGAIGAKVFPGLVSRYWTTQTANADLIGAGIAAGLGAAMYFGSPKTKSAGLATIVAAIAAGPVAKFLNQQISRIGAPVQGWGGAYFGQVDDPVAIQGGVGATAMEPVGLLGDGASTAPPLDVLSGAFGSNFMTR